MRILIVGWFLAVRQIKRSSPWTTALIVFIMALTFLNLVVVAGILIGLPKGAILSYNNEYSGDILFRTIMTKQYIERSQEVIKTTRNFPEVLSLSARYIAPGKVESNYKTAVGSSDAPERVSVSIVGIDQHDEDMVTGLGYRMLIGGELKEGEEGAVLIGKNLLAQYTLGASIISATVLKDVSIGDRVRITVNGHVGEYTVRGVVGSKVGEVSNRVFMSDTELRKLLARDDRNVNEIAIRLKNPDDAIRVRADLKNLGYGEFARVETATESQGTFLDDITKTFTILSDVIGAIGLLVASITVFIVIFINAVTRRKFIGILKGIGISATAIELSYVMQSIFYACCGSVIGLLAVYVFLEPYFLSHPINFPFSDGVLYVPFWGTMQRLFVLLIVTVVAGYFPARMITGKNTLDSILGR